MGLFDLWPKKSRKEEMRERIDENRREGRLRYNYWEEAAEPRDPYSSKRQGEDGFYEAKRLPRRNPGVRLMSDVVEAPNEPCMPREERTKHPTQKRSRW